MTGNVSTPLKVTESSGKYSEISGAILAGGKSTRMGTDKAFLMLQGQAFINIIVEKFKKLFKTVFIVADEQKKFIQAGVPVIPDIYKECGPLGGIHAALRYSPASHIFIAPCDTPLISTDLIQYLITSAKPNEITIGQANERIHPLFGVYPCSAVTIIEQYLNDGKRKVLDVFNEVPHSILSLVHWSNELYNVNDSEEYSRTLHQQ